LMARGFDAATASTRVRRRVAAWLLSIGALLGAAAVLPGLWTPLLEKAIPNAGGVFPLVALRAAAAHLLFGAFFALRDGRLRRAPVLWALLAAVSIDVLSSTRDFIRTRPVAEMEKEPPVASVLRRLEPVPRVVDLLPDEPPQPVPGADEIDGPWDRNRVLGEQLVQWGIPLALDADYDLTNMAASDRARSLLSRLAAQDPAAFGELLAQRSACALLVWKRPIKLEDPVGIARVRDCRPEIDSASAILRFRGDEEFLRVARENKGRLARAVFVEDGADEAAPPPGEASLSEISSRTDRLSFRAECASPCFVRVARTNDGRWKALLDGRPVPVLTANLSLIGLPIPAGSHQVEIRYEDELLRASIGVSAAALLFAAAIVILGGRRRSWIPARRTGSGSPTGARRP
ncbi:MAG TPA: hypothetical protein VKH43_13145, partial [Thermoanaerobaculia bacterium]|nr:hypothetical protein [Thermoanaerobaculia bacterium]